MLTETLPLALALRVASAVAVPHAEVVAVEENDGTASVPLGLLDSLAVAHTESDVVGEPDG